MSVRICGSFSSSAPGAGWDGEVCWMLAAGGCCALQFTSGVSGLSIHAVLRNDFIYGVDDVVVYVYVNVCLLVAVFTLI